MIPSIVSCAEEIGSAQGIVMDEATEAAIDYAVEVISESASEKSEEEIEEYAFCFMQGAQPEHEIRVLGMCPLYGLDEKLTGYYVLFLRDGEPSGYVLISFLHVGTPVVDLAFDGLGIFDNIQDIQMYADTERVKYLGPDEFYVKNLNTNDTYTSLFNHQIITEAEATRIYQNTLLDFQEKVEQLGTMDDTSARGIWGGIIDWTDTTLDGTTEYKLPGFGSGGSYWVTKDFVVNEGIQHCAPTAATNVLWYRGFQCTTNTNNIIRTRVTSGNTNLQKAQFMFQRLFTGMSTGGGGAGTPYANIPSGYTYFLGVSPQSGGVWNYREIIGFPNIFDAIAEQCPIHLHIEKDGVGHGLFVLGRIRDTGGSKYLIVLDGSKRYGRLVVAGYYSNVRGYKIYVTV